MSASLASELRRIADHDSPLDLAQRLSELDSDQFAVCLEQLSDIMGAWDGDRGYRQQIYIGEAIGKSERARLLLMSLAAHALGPVEKPPKRIVCRLGSLPDGSRIAYRADGSSAIIAPSIVGEERIVRGGALFDSSGNRRGSVRGFEEEIVDVIHIPDAP